MQYILPYCDILEPVAVLGALSCAQQDGGQIGIAHYRPMSRYSSSVESQSVIIGAANLGDVLEALNMVGSCLFLTIFPRSSYLKLCSPRESYERDNIRIVVSLQEATNLRETCPIRKRD